MRISELFVLAFKKVGLEERTARFCWPRVRGAAAGVSMVLAWVRLYRVPMVAALGRQEFILWVMASVVVSYSICRLVWATPVERGRKPDAALAGIVGEIGAATIQVRKLRLSHWLFGRLALNGEDQFKIRAPITESIVLGNLFVSMAALVFAPSVRGSIYFIPWFIVGFLSLMLLLMELFNAYVFIPACEVSKRPEERKGYVSHERLLVLLFFNYFQVTLWFAAWYRLLSVCGADTIVGAVRLSLGIMSSFGGVSVDPPDQLELVNVLKLIQAVLGLILTVFMIGRVIGSLHNPERRKQGRPASDRSSRFPPRTDASFCRSASDFQ